MTAVDTRSLGLPDEVKSELSVEHARKLVATLNLPDDLTAGDALPLLWHWAYFTSEAPTADLGSDGHPLIPDGGPTVGLPRRMWAGGRVNAIGTLRIGRSAVRRSKVVRADRKVGRSGPLLVVTVEHQIHQDGELVRTEEQDLVYRGLEVQAVQPAGQRAQPPTPPADWSVVRDLDPVTLFRFSAVTFNSHRIHYDLPYATDVEGYPDLVVHGPLTAMLLFDAAQRRMPGTPSTFEFRATAPLLIGTPFTLSGRSGPRGTELQAVRSDGTTSMVALLS